MVTVAASIRSAAAPGAIQATPAGTALSAVAGSVTAARAEVTRTGAPDATPSRASSSGCSRTPSAAASFATASEWATVTPELYSLRPDHSRRPPFDPAAPAAGAGAVPLQRCSGGGVRPSPGWAPERDGGASVAV